MNAKHGVDHKTLSKDKDTAHKINKCAVSYPTGDNQNCIFLT